MIHFFIASIDLACLRLTRWHVYHAFVDGDNVMINEGGGIETQRATQGDTQTTLVDIKDEPLFEDELASEAT
jgi:hypothetical protein